jgi:hypothetical protein
MIVITISLISWFSAYQKTEIIKLLYPYLHVVVMLLLLCFRSNIIIRQLMIYPCVFTKLRKIACPLLSSANAKWKMRGKCQI